MGMLQEFKEFAVKGNAMDLAVGVIIGGAFGKIVDSIVGDVIMPLVSRVVGKLDFSSLLVVLGDNPNNLVALADLKKAGIPVFAYGSFLTILVNFSFSLSLFS
jgi:large conductance mechanosensitive channel